jgi:xanthine dehydrogenase YagR molybdenum-binding subunit
VPTAPRARRDRGWLVGTAAAIANATHHATGIRVRDLPITLDKLLR